MSSSKPHKPRRNFIVAMGSSAGSFWLTACGGGGALAMVKAEAEADTADALAPVDTADALAPVDTADALAPVDAAADSDAALAPDVPEPATAALQPLPRALVAFTLHGSGNPSGLVAPFCVGHAFRRGDVPTGARLVSNLEALQVTPKNRWPDGSLKFALVAGRVAIGTNQALSIALGIGTPMARDPLTTANLRATAVTASIAASGIGSVSWAGADWDTPFQAWVAGPEMSSWIYRKPIGSDAHLVAWLEVRVFAGGEVEVLPWIENGYLRVPKPTSKAATYTFTLGNSQRFSEIIDLPHHCRTPLINKSALSYWLRDDPGVTPRHDVAYLQATELVPSYRANVAPASASSLASTYTPLQAGDFKYGSDNMASSGYQSPIGLLPTHDVMYLACDNISTYGAVVRNGFSAGRYPIHYRDENTQRPLRFSSYPNLVISDGSGYKDNGASSTGSYTPTVSGTSPRSWDIAHHPSVGYLAYLVTGRWYFMEEVQFAATTNMLGQNNIYIRNFSEGWLLPVPGGLQTRSCAWGIRTLGQAITATPDEDTALRGEFIRSFESNVNRLYALYIEQKNNPFGVVQPGETYGVGLHVVSPWQQDFITAAFGYCISLAPPISAISATRLNEFFSWKAISVIGRLGLAAEFWYINAVPYTMKIGPSSANYANGSGPWYANWSAVYNATNAVAPVWQGSTEGLLAGEFMPGANAQWGNLQPAIAYAVRHAVPGALEAYQRMSGASNWSALVGDFNRYPVWGVRPLVEPAAPVKAIPPIATPTDNPNWLVGKPLNEWFEIPGTASAGGSAVHAYSGFALRDSTSEIIIAAAGGHWDSSDNRVVSLSLQYDSPTWTIRKNASTQALKNVSHYPDGTPTSRHLYQSSFVVESLNRVFLFGARGVYGDSHDFPTVDAFDLNTNRWDSQGTWAPMLRAGAYGTAQVRASQDIYSTSLEKWTANTQKWSKPISSGWVRWPMAHDARRNQLFALMWADGQGYGTARINASRIPVNGSEQIAVTFNSSAAVNQFVADAPTYSAMDYDPENDRFLFYCGQGSGAGRIYVVKPNDGNVWDMGILALGAGSKAPPPVPDAGINGRFRYVPRLKGFVLLTLRSSNLYFIRTA